MLLREFLTVNCVVNLLTLIFISGTILNLLTGATIGCCDSRLLLLLGTADGTCVQTAAQLLHVHLGYDSG